MQAVAATIRRRDLAISRQLVDAGATADQAEAYARETIAAANRLAPVDLRSFERERLGWLARRRGVGKLARGFVDRTGQPPSWQMPLDDAGTRNPPATSAIEPRTGDSPRDQRGVHDNDFKSLLKGLVERAPR